MCSIYGIYNYGGSDKELESYNNRMRHRGPDSTDYKIMTMNNRKLIFYHNRLSIQDLSIMGNQPMESKNYLIVFNGEIYNHNEIRRDLGNIKFKSTSDTETVLECIEKFGIHKTIEKLNGMFSIGLFDKLNKKLFLIRDRIGIKPLFYSEKNNKFCFSSEIKSIPDYFKDKANDIGLIQFMTFGYTAVENTSYLNIKKLPPAHILEYDGINITIKKYWNLRYSEDLIDYQDAVNETHRLLNDSVNLRLLSDVEVGCFLSGGIDSSLVASIMQKNSFSKINTFSIGFENKKYDESVHAKNVSKYLNTNHFNFIFKENDVFDLIDENKSSFDEPFGDASALPMHLLARETKKSVTVALSGDGGDELFIGYDRYFKTQKFFNLFSKIPQDVRNFISLIFHFSNIDKLKKISYPIKYLNMQNAYSVLFTHIKPWELKNIFNKEFLEKSLAKQNLENILGFEIGHYSSFKKFRNIDLNSYLCDDILTKVDRMTMKHSLEARVPILDHRIIEFSNTIPSRIHLKNGPKSILKSILNEYIPKHLTDRPKTGFAVPLKYWFRGKLKSIVQDKINSLDNRFNKDSLNKIFLEHQKGKNFEYVLWNILQL